MRVPVVILLSLFLGLGFGVGWIAVMDRLAAWDSSLETDPEAAKQREASAISRTLNPNAKLDVKETVHDFGIMYEKDSGRCDFYIKNIGSEVLTLEPNRTTCQCTGIDVSPKRVSPGGTAKVTLRWDSDRATGKFRQQATVITNDPDYPEVIFTIQGLFIQPIIANTTLNVPVIYNGTSDEQETSSAIYGFEKTPDLQILSIDWVEKEFFDASVEKVELNEIDKEDSLKQLATAKYILKIKVKPGQPVGPYIQKFTVKTNYASEPSLDFLVRGQVSAGGLSFVGKGYNRNQGFLDMGVLSGTDYEHNVNLILTGTGAEETKVEIEEVYPKWLKIDIAEDRNAGTEVRSMRIITFSIKVPAGSSSGDYSSISDGRNGYVTLKTSNPDNPTIHLPILFVIPGR